MIKIDLGLGIQIISYPLNESMRRDLEIDFGFGNSHPLPANQYEERFQSISKSSY